MPPPSASYHHYRLTPAVSYCRPLYTTVTLPTTPYHRQLYITYRLSPTTDCTLLPTASYYRSPRPTAARDFRTYSSAAGCTHTRARTHPSPRARTRSLATASLATSLSTRGVRQRSRRAQTTDVPCRVYTAPMRPCPRQCACPSPAAMSVAIATHRTPDADKADGKQVAMGGRRSLPPLAVVTSDPNTGAPV